MVIDGPFEAKYWNAMQTVLATLYKNLKAWEYVLCTSNIRVLPSAWAFRCKRCPDGKATNFKAPVFFHGDHQVQGLDYLQIWAPVCHWSTIHTMVVLAAKWEFCSAQCDITDIFLHVRLTDDKHIYVHQPRGFKKTVTTFSASSVHFVAQNKAPGTSFGTCQRVWRSKGLYIPYTILVFFSARISLLFSMLMICWCMDVTRLRSIHSSVAWQTKTMSSSNVRAPHKATPG